MPRRLVLSLLSAMIAAAFPAAAAAQEPVDDATAGWPRA
jgi:hypothetical protein